MPVWIAHFAGLAEKLTLSLDPLREIWCVSGPRRERDPAKAAGFDEGFHAGIVAVVGNLEVARMRADVNERIRIIRRLDFTKPECMATTYEEYSAILDAIGASDAVLGRQMIRAHIAESRAEVKRITHLHDADRSGKDGAREEA